MQESTKELLRGALLSIWIGFIGFIVVMGLFFFKAAETDEYMQKSMFYFGMGALFLIAVVSGITTITYLIKSNKLSYEKYGWVNLFIHDPKEDSFLADTPLKKYLTFSNILHFSIVFGLIMSLYSAVTNTFFIALPATEFQVSETGKLILATEPAAIMETIMMIFVIGFLTGFGKWTIYIYKLTENLKYAFIFIIPLISGAIWMGIHLVRYGASETNFLATGFFGLSGTIITLLTGSIIPFYIWHVFNNLLAKSIEMFSNEFILPIIVFLLMIYISILIIYKIIKKRK